MFNLYLDMEPCFKTFVRSLYAEHLCEASIQNLYDKPFFAKSLCGPFIWNLGGPGPL